ncbi:MAG TPA: succinylglutamate desuccinylase/aspartoacylase family protein [Clostridia bacterium]|nr:succinylglutamate desuccinylase/aspartoacylase family protein [Clostridia bacterium]
MKLCGIDINPGEKKEVRLNVPGGGHMDATLIRGAHGGKTLAVTAGVHGCEYVGIEALRRLSRSLNPEELRGQVILIPLVNPEGFYACAKQVVPSDGVNLNRAFPGAREGLESARRAFAIEQFVYPYTDLLADLHGGDIHEQVTPFAFFPAHAAADVVDRSRAAAGALSLPFRVRSSGKNGLYSWAAQRGIPALLLERGCRGVWAEEDVRACCDNIHELLVHLDILERHFEPVVQREIARVEYVEAEERGFWYPAVREGQFVQTGAELGELRAYDGGLLRRYEALFDGVVLYYTVTLGAQAADPLVSYGQV